MSDDNHIAIQRLEPRLDALSQQGIALALWRHEMPSVKPTALHRNRIVFAELAPSQALPASKAQLAQTIVYDEGIGRN